MFYKVILNGTVVDVQTCLRYVFWQEANQMAIVCKEESANGILSSDGSVIWHVKGYPQFPNGEYQTVIVEEIEEDEFLRWQERLTSQVAEIPAEQEPDEETNNEQNDKNVLQQQTSIQLLLIVRELEEKVSKLEASNKELSERLLEISEKTYT